MKKEIHNLELFHFSLQINPFVCEDDVFMSPHARGWKHAQILDPRKTEHQPKPSSSSSDGHSLQLQVLLIEYINKSVFFGGNKVQIVPAG